MKAYVITTGLVFALLFLVHVARIFVEGMHVAQDPFFLTTTVIAFVLFLWAIRVFVVLTRKST